MESWTYCASDAPWPYFAASAARLSRFGPVVPVVLAAASVWQPPQFWVKTALAFTAPPDDDGGGALAAAFCCRSQASNCLGGTTITTERIWLCPIPHSSLQMMLYVPIRVGVATSCVCRPGTASSFSRKAGT